MRPAANECGPPFSCTKAALQLQLGDLRAALNKALQFQRYSFVERAKLAAIEALSTLQPADES